MIEYDNQYKALLVRVMNEGVDVKDRTGTGCRKVFDAKIKVDLSGDDTHYHIPVGSLRKIYPKVAWYELLWMLRGSTNANELKEKGIRIWDANSSREFQKSRGLDFLREGFIGPKAYGYQFRQWNGFYDQLAATIGGILSDPHGRRHLISLWNPTDYDQQCLAPCHYAYNFVVTGEKLNLKFQMRSHDLVLANNTNLLFASYFLILMCHWTGYQAGEVVQDIADCHIYHNLFDAAELMIEAEPYDRTWVIPKVHSSWKVPFSDLLLENLFFDEFPCDENKTSYELMVRDHNEHLLGLTNPPIPKQYMQISA